MIQIRGERADDRSAIREINLRAFQSSMEADLVDALRNEAEPFLSLVAEKDDHLIGHICFTPVEILSNGAQPSAAGAPALTMGLAPMAVLPRFQRKGVGTALVREGLSKCRALGAGAVVVLGHPEYYPRFGFRPSTAFALRSEYDVPDEAFMAIELKSGALRRIGGTVRYLPAFSRLS